MMDLKNHTERLYSSLNSASDEIKASLEEMMTTIVNIQTAMKIKNINYMIIISFFGQYWS